MSIKFDDGSIIDSDDWELMKQIISGTAQKGEKKISEIKSADGVTVKVGNLQAKKKTQKKEENPNYTTGNYKGWTIRVWPHTDSDGSRTWACNYFLGENTQYLEVYQNDYSENSVFTLARRYIDQILAGQGVKV